MEILIQVIQGMASLLAKHYPIGNHLKI